MYEEYYGFVRPPFSLTPDPRFLYRSESHDVALQQVWQAIRRKEGFIVLTGDIGTGKTTLCRTILEQFDPTTFTALVLNPFVTVEELLREVLVSFGVASRDALRTTRLSTASKHDLIRTLHDFLLSLVPIHGSAVLIIDEAQHLSPDVLEEIRILSNLETNDQKLLQILLVGQLNLVDALHDAKLRQLHQRVSIRCVLQPLNRREVEAYINHRLWVAGGARPPVFTTTAVETVHSLSGGIPRLINLLCDRALMKGAEARTTEISEAIVVEGAHALGLAAISRPVAPSARFAQPRASAFGVAAIAALVAVALLLAFSVVSVNPFGRIDTDDLPVAVPPAPLAAGIANSPTASPADNVLRVGSPPLTEGNVAVLIGTFTSAREAVAAERAVRARGLPIYAVDMRFRDGIRRRLFVGRFRTREEAEKVRSDIAGVFAEARLVTAASELWE